MTASFVLPWPASTATFREHTQLPHLTRFTSCMRQSATLTMTWGLGASPKVLSLHGQATPTLLLSMRHTVPCMLCQYAACAKEVLMICVSYHSCVKPTAHTCLSLSLLPCTVSLSHSRTQTLTVSLFLSLSLHSSLPWLVTQRSKHSVLLMPVCLCRCLGLLRSSRLSAGHQTSQCGCRLFTRLHNCHELRVLGWL